MKDQPRLAAALQRATSALLAEMNLAGHWTGELSSSALSTATAVVALANVDSARHAALICGGLRWLAEHVNADGGWGDTTRSKSNISTTALCWAAFGAANADSEYPTVVQNAEAWLRECGTGVTPVGQAGILPGGGGKASSASDEYRAGRPVAPQAGSLCHDYAWRTDLLPAAITHRYGKDRTFSVPILMTLALSGRLGADGWRLIPKLPFELAAMSHKFWGALRLPVVSYALPALIAIGQAIHHHAPTRNPLTRMLRALSRKKTLRVLETLQPPNGGFLEATPLTSFVTMSLASMGLASYPVARKGAEFLVASAREDGSWAIDTNLATWTTTLAIKALAHQPGALSSEQCRVLREWLLGQQWNVEHPYTHAAPGGWAWTDLPGGVPDADDTPGALLALRRLGPPDDGTRSAALSGVRWLLGLQNRDSGIPTFCRGWGALPFDRSSQDLTAHTLRAWNAWRTEVDPRARPALVRAMTRGLGYLIRTQRDDGAWVPLWFGNEHAPHDENPLYGTAHVVCALRELSESGLMPAKAPAARGAAWIAASQNDDGGWGGVRGVPSSVEETALAVEALAGTSHSDSVERGVAWLIERVESGAWREPSPIGFYFARLWYHERLYPLIWTVGALGRACRCAQRVAECRE
ncbi:MAG: prenyltransferase/squalene oxidase repeat-containing protein [Chthoniobacteraceae bacterium]